MKKSVIRLLLLVVLIGGFSDIAIAQKKKTPVKKRTSAKRTTKTTTNAKVQAAQPVVDTVAAVVVTPEPAIDSLPLKRVAKSLRRDAAVDDDAIRDRTPLPYEHLRADDAVFRHKIWREIDTREKINLPFRYSADQDNGNQRFISILLQAIQDSLVTVFSSADDRFTTPMTKSEIAKAVAGDPVDVPLYNENGEVTGYKKMVNDINFDSFYKFRIKE
jgi:hypothetical protein